VLSSGLGLALTPVPLIAAMLLVYGLQPRWTRLARPVALASVVVTCALLVVDAAVVAGGGRVQVSLGNQLGGVTLLLRADPTGVVIAFAATIAAGLTLLDRSRRRAEVIGVLVCLLGSVTAALAGDAITLFAGVEVANLGGLVVLAPTRGRAGRGTLAALAIEHLAALGLLAAAVELQVTQGTSAFAVLPAGALTASVAWPWAVAGAVRLLSPGIVPVRGAGLPSGTLAAVAAVPCGAAMILRLRDAAGGAALPSSAQIVLDIVGAMAALGGAAAAMRYWRSPASAGRGLCLAVAGPVLIVTGMAGAAAATAVAAGLCSLELAVACSTAWERGSLADRWLTPAAFLAAGGLPTGFGATALVLEIGAVAVLGRARLALLVVLLIAAVGAAGAATTMAWAAFRSPRRGPRALPVLAVLAVALSALAAILPGGTAATVVDLLAGGGVSRPAGAAAVLGPGGGWAGGYFLVAGLFLAIAGAAALRLSGTRLPHDAARRPAPPTVPGPLPLPLWRSLRGPVGFGLFAASRVDEWLIVQPQLPLLVGGAVLALILIH
jgi:hypothetical protein